MQPLGVYIHIPFCHSLCYYCGCNKIVTRNEERVARLRNLMATGPLDQAKSELNELLDHLARIDSRVVRVVECRFFAGLTEEETAQALDVTSRTVQRDWKKAKVWLQAALQELSPINREAILLKDIQELPLEDGCI